MPAPPDHPLTPLTDLIRARRAVTADAGATVVAVDGAVSVGKSTISATISETLGLPPDELTVKVVSSDGFLLPNRVLQARGLVMHKGFPDTYDHGALEAFVVSARSGSPELQVPVYSHETYDVLDTRDVFDVPDVLVLEGLHTTRLASLVDVTVYVDADEADIERWYTERFLELTAAGTGFYAQFTSLSHEAIVAFAEQVWSEINAPNLHQYILPNRELAEVVVRKGPDHAVVDVTVHERARPAAQREE